jgi:DNA repair exonuclease SbcCD ATPase subunit
MKTLYIIIPVILLSVTGIKAQMPILVADDSMKVGKSNMPALSVTIPEADYEKTLKIWIRELQSGTKSKVVIENSEISIFGAEKKGICATPINIYSKLLNRDSLLQLVVSVELKKDQYVERSSSQAEYAKVQKYLKDFARDQYISVAKDQADAEDNKLRDIQKELSSLEKEKARLQKSIQSNNSTIADEKENIVIQQNELTSVSAALIEHNKLLTAMEPASTAQKEKIAYIKDLEKKEKKLRNSIESSENKINKANNEIEKAVKEIPLNEKTQQKVTEKVAEQDAVYQKYADKLAKIKSY